MRAEGTVTEIVDETHAIVRTVRKSACAECHKTEGGSCRACDVFFGSDSIETNVVNKVKAKPGDQVIIESSSAYVIITAAVVFLVPVLLAGIGYCIGDFALGLTDIAPMFALAGFVAGIAAVMIYGKANKSRERIIITEILN